MNLEGIAQNHRKENGRLNAALDAISQTLRKVVRSPFSEEIEHTEMSRHFTRLPFTCYDGKINPVEHVSHYTQLMVLYSWNDGLMCKVFPSNLGPTTMRVF